VGYLLEQVVVRLQHFQVLEVPEPVGERAQRVPGDVEDAQPGEPSDRVRQRIEAVARQIQLPKAQELR
jgi:hypothetical protein